MILAKVTGTVVAEARAATLGGHQLRLVQVLDGRTLEPRGGVQVAADVTGAGEGDLVVLSSGASGRMAGNLSAAPVDLVIIAIIDELADAGGALYKSQRKVERS
jgi:microcompartment protein CcmK/EutM